MARANFSFDRFELDRDDRQLRRDGAPVELSSRYFDALVLLVCEQGRLVPKDRFMDEVWRGVPVTDEALTQCIRTLRRQLGDEAGRPRFIETVPKHGYRFIAPVTELERNDGPGSEPAWEQVFVAGGAGTAGAAVAGLVGGLVYGLAAASQPHAPGVGALSVLVVLTLLCLIVAVTGGAGVSFGIAAADFAGRGRALWSMAGGALGGLIVGAAVKLLGLDAFALLVGQSPGDITGAGEGALLGAAVGFAAWLAGLRRPSLRRAIVAGGLLGAAAGMAAVLLGGRMMAGSLELFATRFPESRLSLANIGAIFGEHGLGPHSQIVTGTLEGGLFGACVVGAMTLARTRR